MWLDQVLPSYLFLQQFCDHGEVLDLFPPGPAGAGLLARAGVKIRTVLSRKINDAGDYPAPIRASLGDLPFRRGSQRLVISTTLFTEIPAQEREALLKEIRSLVSVDGLVALVLPNAKRMSPLFQADEAWPGFGDFETSLRRHFPHVAMVAQRPVVGAALEPLGKTGRIETALNDSQVTPELEIPTHYIALCSPKYKRLSELMIAHLPFSGFEEAVSREIDGLRTSLDVSRHDSAAQSMEIGRLRGEMEKLARSLVEMESREREHSQSRTESAIALQRMEVMEKALARADDRIQEMEKQRAESERRALEAERAVRRIERDMADLRVENQRVEEERDELEARRVKLQESISGLQSKAKALQRDNDDRTEQIAGYEHDLSIRNDEIGTLSRDLREERNRRVEAEQRLADLETRQGSIALMEKTLRERAEAAERDREAAQKSLAAATDSQTITQKERSAFLAEIQSLQSEAERLNAEIRSLRRKADEQASAAEKEAEENRALRKRVLELETRKEEETGEAGTLRTLVEQKTSELQMLAGESLAIRVEEEAKREALETELETLKKERLEADGRQRDLEAKLGASEREKEDFRSKSEANWNLEQELGRENESLRDQLRRLRESFVNREGELEKEIAGLKQEVETARELKAWTPSAGGGEAEGRARTEALEAEVKRLRSENEVGLMAVKEDIETELRLVRTQLDTRDSELWEAREEITRLQAEVAATIDKADQDGKAEPLKKSLEEQEIKISCISRERDGLVKLGEKLERSLARRRSQVKKLLAIVKSERALYRETGKQELAEMSDEELERYFGVEDEDEEPKDGELDS